MVYLLWLLLSFTTIEQDFTDIIVVVFVYNDQNPQWRLINSRTLHLQTFGVFLKHILN